MAFTNSYTWSELISPASDTTVVEIQKRKPLLKSFLAILTKALFRNPDPGLTFHQVVTPSGDGLWVAHDPTSGKIHQFDSEEMARSWVEEHYYAGH